MQDLKKNLYQQGQELKMNKACPLCQFKCVADHILKAHMLRKHTSKGTIHILRKYLYSKKLNFSQKLGLFVKKKNNFSTLHFSEILTL